MADAVRDFVFASDGVSDKTSTEFETKAKTEFCVFEAR
jgi:hypothetical protein